MHSFAAPTRIVESLDDCGGEVTQNTMNRHLPTVIGTDQRTKLASGKTARVVLLNNAATTPPFASTLASVNAYLQTYGALHRGAGPHANATYEKAQDAINTIGRFIGLRKDQSLLFTQNTSAAINLFIRMLGLTKKDTIITSEIEHTSNNLPWSFNSKACVVKARAFDDGSLDYIDLEAKVKKYAKTLKLIAVTGASNLSGSIPDIRKIAKLAHAHGAMLFVDAAQLVPHRPINMKRDGIDALAFSAHKVYAPFGLGVLALPRAIMDVQPVDPGGGSIDMLSEKDVTWAPPTHRHQTGTWNVTGIIALGESCKTILKTGWKTILAHESRLVAYTAEQLATVPGLIFYVQPDAYIREHRIGTFCFNLPHYHHALLSAVLDKEYGIETRAGTICNHRLVRRWMRIGEQEQKKIETKIKQGNRLASYGIVRVSLGIENTKQDIDALVAALSTIVAKGPQRKYAPVTEEETYEIVK